MAAKTAKGAGPRKPKRAAPEAAPTAFEATCPFCGTTADAPDGADAMACPACGQVVQLVDAEPPVPQATPGRPEWPWSATFIALGGGFVLAAPLLAYNFAIDRLEPQTGLATMWLIITLLGMAALGFVLRRRLVDDGWWMGVLLSGILVGFFATIPAYLMAADYGKEGGAFLAGIGPALAFVYLYLPSFALAAVAALVAAIWSNRVGGAILAAYGLGVAVGIALVAVYMLVTLPEQAEEAREANEAPTLQAVAVLAAVLGAAMWRRRQAR